MTPGSAAVPLILAYIASSIALSASSIRTLSFFHPHSQLPPSHSQQADTMPDKEKKSTFSRFRKFWHHKSDPASNTKGVVNDSECTLWLFLQALTLHAAVHFPLKILTLDDKS